jgi:hypothetical protein
MVSFFVLKAFFFAFEVAPSHDASSAESLFIVYAAADPISSHHPCNIFQKGIQVMFSWMLQDPMGSNKVTS